jgi:TfoX/Sxy family transcriptional regulator of competence genes
MMSDELLSGVKEAAEALQLKASTYSGAITYLLSAEGAALRMGIAAAKDQVPQEVLENLSDLITEHDIKYAAQGDRAARLFAPFMSLEKLLSKQGLESSHEYFESILFLDLVAGIELFFVDALKAVLTQHPLKLGKDVEFPLHELLGGKTQQEFVMEAADKKINKLMYKRPSEYLRDFCELLSISENVISPFWGTYIEAKCRRDLGAHNNWVCNKVYLRKLDEAQIQTESCEGDKLLPRYSGYGCDLGMCAIKMPMAVHKALIDKYST